MKTPFLALGLASSILCVSAIAGGNDSLSTSDVLVEIDGAKITLGQFEQKESTALFQARNTYYEAQRKAADAFVDQYLLEKQAQKENVTIPELLERHVNSTIAKDPSEETFRVFYEALPGNQNYEAVKAQMVEHLRQVRIDKAKAAYMKSLRDAASIDVKLEAPRAPVSLKDTPVRGSLNAPVTIVEFADYECPYCQQAQPALNKFEAEYKGKVAFAYKDTPLPMHPHAEKAAEATHCAEKQGKYWEFHDAIFDGKKLDVSDLKETARALKLDGEAFDKCLDAGDFAELVKAQLTEAQSYKLQGTPSFFINGRFYEGVLTYDQLRKAADEELGKTAPSPVAQR